MIPAAPGTMLWDAAPYDILVTDQNAAATLLYASLNVAWDTPAMLIKSAATQANPTLNGIQDGFGGCTLRLGFPRSGVDAQREDIHTSIERQRCGSTKAEAI